MFERFTPAARVGIVLAQEAARQAKWNHIRCRHLLVGLARSPGSDSAAILQLAGFDHEAQQARDRRNGAWYRAGAEGTVPLSVGAKGVLEGLFWELAGTPPSTHVTSADLLAALLAEPWPEDHRWLRRVGLTSPEILRMRDGLAAHEPGPGEGPEASEVPIEGTPGAESSIDG